MADLFRTGRTRRLTLEWAFSVEAAYRALQPVGEGYTGGSGIAVAWMGFEVWAGSPGDVCGRSDTGAPPNGFLLPIAGGPDGLSWVLQIRLPGDPDTGFGGYFNAHGPWGHVGAEMPVAAYKPLGMPTVPPGARYGVVGTCTLWMDVEEWKAIEIDAGTPRVPLSYPTSGQGPADDEFVGMCTMHYYEGPQGGGQYGFEITVEEGFGAAASGDIPADIVGPDVLAHTPTVRLFHSPSNAEGFAGSVSVMHLNELPINFDRVACEQPNYSCAGSAEGTLYGETDAHASGPYLATCECAPDTDLRPSGVTTKVFEPNYGGTVRYRRSWAEPAEVEKANGVYEGPTETYTEQRAAIERCEGGIPVPLCDVLLPRPDLFLWLDNEWLVQNGEIPQDWRIMIADDFSWTPFELAHTAARTVDAFDSADGWVGDNATVTASGGILRVVVAGGEGSVRKSFSRDASQYRKLRLTARSNPAGPCLVHLNDSDLYVWELDLTTGFRDYVLDLCVPEGASAASDLTDSSYVPPGEYYGPRRIESVGLERLASGTTYSFADLSLVRTREVSLIALPPFDESVMGDDGVRRYRLCWGLCDGRQVLDMPYRVEDARSDRFLTVRELIEELTSHDACDVRVPTPPGSDERTRYYYDHDSRLAAFMASEWYPGGARRDLLDVSLVGRTPMRWLQRYDKVGIYPGIGDPSGSHGGPYPLRFTKRLRAMCHGLTVDAAQHRAAEGVPVILFRNGSSYTSVVSGEEGYYRVGPFPPTDGTWSIGTLQSGPVLLASGLTDRKYRWIGLAGEPGTPGGETRMTHNETGRVFMAYTAPDGLRLRRFEADERSENFVLEPGYVGGGFGIAWSVPGRLHSVLVLDGAVWHRRSLDDGETWVEDVMVFASATHPNLAADPVTGFLYAFSYDGGGIRCRRSTDGGSTWSDPVTVVAQCPEQTCGVTIRPDGANTLLVSYLDATGEVRLSRSLDNGITWQE